MFSRTDLREYQKKAISFVRDKGSCGLALDMGLGKTVSTLTAVSDMFDAFEIGRVLIIAPLRVANSVWLQESQKWEHLKHLNIAVATGSEKNRINAINSSAQIVVINRENVVWLIRHFKSIKNWCFDVVVIDESSSFKNPSAKRFRALKKTLSKIDKMILLCGTPCPKGYLDLWSQQYLIDSGAKLGKTYSSYRDRYFYPDYSGYNFQMHESSQKIIEDLLKDCWLSMSSEDYLDLPERIDLMVNLDLPQELQKQYTAFENKLIVDIDGIEIDAINAGVLAGKLLQWCNGAVYYDEEKNYTEIHDVKINALKEIIEDNPNENILVAYNYKHDLARLQKHFPEIRVLNDNKDIDDWNAGKIKLLCAHPQSAGEGLNLQDGGAFCVWFSLPRSLMYYLQFNKRLWRQGQTRPVKIAHLVIKNCLDEDLIKVLESRESLQTAYLTAIKQKISQYHNKSVAILQ